MPAINYKKRRNKVCQGFTLMEIIVVVSILGLLSIVFSSFLLSSLSGNAKSEILKEVRQNGNYALSVMEGMILNSTAVSCPSAKEVDVLDKDGLLTAFVCDETADNEKISSNGASLTGSNIAVSSCVFTCSQIPGRPSKVDISFVVSAKNVANLRTSENASMPFSSTVVTKNF